MARPFSPAKTRELRACRGIAWNALAKLPALLGRVPLWRDESGATAMIVGLGATMLVGFAGLGTEMGVWYFNHRNLQNATDSAAMSAETAIYQGSASFASEAKGTAARYGFVDGSNGTTVTVNRPPLSGAFAGNADDVEVIISAPQTRLFTAMFSSNALTQTARSVAQIKTNGDGCVVTLDRNKVEDFFDNGNTKLNLVGCNLYVNSSACDALDQTGNAIIDAKGVYVVGGGTANCTGISGTANTSIKGPTFTGVAPTSDPYANVQPPDTSGSCSKDSTGLTPGVYCGGWKPQSGKLLPGVYVVKGGCACLSGNTVVSGDGVTIYLTADSNSNYANMQISGNAELNISPPTTGPTQGISIFQDRNAPQPQCTDGSPCISQNNISGNGSAITGVLYFPSQNLTYNGNASNGTTPQCTQVVALTLTFHGNSAFQNNCTGVPGVAKIGAIPARLVE